VANKSSKCVGSLSTPTWVQQKTKYESKVKIKDEKKIQGMLATLQSENSYLPCSIQKPED
jgi:hypothetical protein